MTRTMLPLAILFVAILGSQADDKNNVIQSSEGWGGLKGKVVFEGDLKAQILRPILNPIAVYEPQSREDAKNGVERKIRKMVPNESLLVNEKSMGIQHVFVYLKETPKKIHPSLTQQKLDPVKLTYRDYQFFPHSSIVRVGQTVRMTNLDEAEQNTFRADFIKNDFFNVLVKKDQKPFEWSPKVPERLPMRVSDNLHPHVKAHWLMLDHPYAVISDSNGQFEINDLPEGEHELVIWHELTGYVQKKVKVAIRDGKVTEVGPFKITVEKLK